jgi:hypothetical protein
MHSINGVFVCAPRVQSELSHLCVHILILSGSTGLHKTGTATAHIPLPLLANEVSTEKLIS